MVATGDGAKLTLSPLSDMLVLLPSVGFSMLNAMVELILPGIITL